MRSTPGGRGVVPGAGSILSLGVWAGLLAGGVELAYLALRKYVRHLFLFRGLDTLWMTPLATALLFAAAGILLLLLLPRRRDALPSIAVGVYAFLAVLGSLFLISTFHRGAALVLALGVGIQTGRLSRGHEPALHAVVRRTIPLLLAVLAVTMVAVRGIRWWEERSAIKAIGTARTGLPNVLLLVLDTVRALNLSVYGYHRPTTPNLERLAARGVRFNRALSTAPWTLPAHASLFTGTWAHAQTTDWYQPLDSDAPTLATVLAQAGYRTGGFVANTSYCSRETGLARGFSRYEDYSVTAGTFLTSSSLIATLAGLDLVRGTVGTDQLIVRKTAAAVDEHFLRWLDVDRTRPFFAFLNYYDAHTPYLPPRDYRGRFRTPGVPLVPNLERHEVRDGSWTPEQVQGAMDAYDGAIAYLDAEIGRLFEALDRRGLLDNTVVIVTADHGEEFNEHGLIHHGNSLYRASVQVPLLIAWPGRVPADTTFGAPVSIRDIPSTVLDLTGTSAPVFPGASLARFWRSQVAPDDTLLSELKYAPQQPAWYPASKGPMFSAVGGGLRYIKSGDGTEELFDFERDPQEQTDLAGQPEFAPDLIRFRAMAQALSDSGSAVRR